MATSASIKMVIMIAEVIAMYADSLFFMDEDSSISNKIAFSLKRCFLD